MISQSSSWPKTVLRKWLNMRSEEFYSDCNSIDDDVGEMQSRRKSCLDRDGGLSGGWLVECSEDVEPRRLETTASPIDNLKLFVGSWNVGGRAPHGELRLRDWLMSTPTSPADIYVLGFQEIVRLNAGNVLGAEDSGPAHWWLSLIRRALNSQRRSSPSATSDVQPEQKPRLSISDLLSVQDCEDEADDEDGSTNLNSIGGEESPDSSPTTARRSSEYRLAASKQMVGVFLCVWVRASLVQRITDLKVSCVGRGIMGYMGNKGSISISMTLRQTTFCFVCTHLASGEKDGDEVRRNSDVIEIMKRTRFRQSSRFPGLAGCSPETIMEHDKIIWLGDLNYRLAATCSDVHDLLQKNDWQTLLDQDQLRIEQRGGRVFSGWKEGPICFPPTYKYLANSDVYAVKLAKSKEKRRTPAWCDRILWRGKGMTQVWYMRGESKFSDHRPVSSLFSVQMDEPQDKFFSKALCVRTAAAAMAAKNSGTSSSSWGRVQAEELLPIVRAQSCLESARF